MGGEGDSPRKPEYVEAVDSAGGLLDDGDRMLRVKVVQGASASGGTASTDEAGFSEGGSNGTPAMAAVADSPAADAPEDSLAILRATPKRALHANLRDADGAERKPLTDAELRASSVPVTGPLTNAELRATPVPVETELSAAGPLALEATLVQVRDRLPSAEFARIKDRRFTDAEEVRYDLGTTDLYVGVAADGTATSATSWTIVRTYLDASGNPTRERIRSGVAWNDRTTGWT